MEPDVLPNLMTIAATTRLEWAALSDQGQRRQNNEDAWTAVALGDVLARLPDEPRLWPEPGFLLVVSDGMGGAKSGEFASRITVDRLTRMMPRAFRMSAAGMDSGFTDVLEELVRSIHQDLSLLGQAYEEVANFPMPGRVLTLGVRLSSPR